MGRVDRDIDAVIDFCNEFKAKYLEEMSKAANNLEIVGTQISAATSGTAFASRSEEEVLRMAHNIKNAVAMGAPVPSWLSRLLAAGKNAVDAAGDAIAPEEKGEE